MTRSTLLLAAGLAALASPAQSQAPATPPAASLQPANGAEFSNGSATVRITALGESILRVRIARGREFPEDSSWSVPAEVRDRRVAIRPTADGFETGTIAVHVDPASLQLTVADLHGRSIVSDTADAARFEGHRFVLRKTMPSGEQYFGMGDKTGPFDRRGASYVNWNTDAWGFDRGTDPIY